MSNESDNFFQRRKPLQPVYGVQVDSASGFAFQKRAKTNHATDDLRRSFDSPESPIRVKPVSRFNYEAANDRYDEQIRGHLVSPDSPDTVDTATTATSSQLINNFPDVPPPNIKPHEYYRHIPTNLKKEARLRQMLYWFAQNELRDDRYMVRNKNPIVEKVKQQLLEKLKTSDSILSLSARRNHVDNVSENELVNEKLKERLAQLKKDIADIKLETEAWQNCADKVYEEHATTMDRVAALRENNFKQEFNLDFVKDLDPEQQEFVKNMLEDKPEHKISDVIADMNSDVTNMRQILNTSYQFVLESDRFVKKYKKELAEKVEEDSRIIPIDADVRILGPNEDTAEKRKQDEFKNLEKLIRLSTRQKAKKSNENDKNDNDSSNNTSNMDLD